MLNLRFNKSFLSIFISSAIGVTTIKNIIPITTGETILPKKIPNLNHRILKGVKNLEFNNPKIKKIIEIIRDQILIFSSFNNGNIEIIKKK